MIACATFGVGAYGVSQMKVEFDPTHLVPIDSYLKLFVNTNEEYFSSGAINATIYSGPIGYNVEDFEKLDNLVDRLGNLRDEEYFVQGKEGLAYLFSCVRALNVLLAQAQVTLINAAGD